MDTTSKVLLYAFLAIPALYAVAFLLALGPLGLFGLAFALLAALAASTWVEDDADASPDRTNCAECGSPNPPERDRCSYCDAPLDGDN